MEGERILKDLKTLELEREAADKFQIRVNDYLAPLFQEDAASLCDVAIFSKLEVFSVRLLKLSIERAKTSEKPSSSSSSSSASSPFIKFCQLAVSALKVCAGSSPVGKLPPHSYEKLLLHYLQLCVARHKFSEVAESCRTLRERLVVREEEEEEEERRGRGEHGKEKKKKKEELEKEGDTLLKHAFDISWKAAHSLEQNVSQKKIKHGSLPSNEIDLAKICLELRQEALACVVVVRDTANSRFLVERILWSSKKFQQQIISANSVSLFERLLAFHRMLLSLRDFPSSLLLTRAHNDTFLAVDYLCHLSRIANQAGHTHQSTEYLARAKKAVHNSSGKENDANLVARKKRIERSNQIDQSNSSLLTSLVGLTTSVIHLETEEHIPKTKESLGHNLRVSAEEMECAVNGRCDVVQLQRLCDIIEQLFNLMHCRCRRGKNRDSPCSLVILREAFPSLASLVVYQVIVGERRETERVDSAGKTIINQGQQWLRKISFLIDYLRESCCYGDVMETLASVARRIPARMLCDGGDGGGGGEVMVGWWVRGKRELLISSDTVDNEKWKNRSFLSLVPPSSPPLSIRAKSLLLTTELTKLSSSSSSSSRSYGHVTGLTNEMSVAVGYELLEVYRDGGREWDVEKGKLMIDLSTNDRSILDEAIRVLEGVASNIDHAHSLSDRRRAFLPLALALVLKSISLLQDRMGSCDDDWHGGSHDPGSKSCDREEWECFGQEEEEEEEVEGYLYGAIERMCDWVEGGGGGEERDVEQAMFLLRVTAELCSLTCQFSSAGRLCWILDKLRDHIHSPPYPAVFLTCLSSVTSLLIQGGGLLAEQDDVRAMDVEVWLSETVGVADGEKRGREVTTAILSCQLTLASLHLQQRKFEKCRQELVELFHEAFLSRHTLSAHILSAGTKFTSAHLLLTSPNTPLLSLRPFLNCLLDDGATPATSHTHGNKERFRATPQEMMSSVVKTLSSLFHHFTILDSSIGGSKGRESDEEVMVMMWGVVRRLLESQLVLSRLLLLQGAVREALYYAREGGNLAKILKLKQWHGMFVQVGIDVQLTKGGDNSDPCCFSSSSSYPSSLISSPYTLGSANDLRSTLVTAESLITSGNPSRAISLCEEKIHELSGERVGVAWLHLLAGRAVLEEVAVVRPVLMEELRESRDCVCTSQNRRRRGGGRGGRGGGGGRKVLGWLSIMPEPFQKALEHFCFSLQLCYPICPPQPLREVYKWMSVLLSSYHPSLAAHCLFQSSHISLAHKATSVLGKKFQKKLQSHSHSRPFHDVLIALQDDLEGFPGSGDCLVMARSLLQPSQSPPSLSHTLSLLSSLPSQCLFTTISLAPSLHSQNGQALLLLCVAGKNREPLFVKSQIETEPLLSRFAAMISDSEASLKLSEKRKWWNIRRKLDRQMKDFVRDLQAEWLGDRVEIFDPLESPDSPRGTATARTEWYHLLCTGRLIQHLPWEAIPVLREKPVGRVPSLAFSIAHQLLQRAHTPVELDGGLGYYVLNPRGDLPDTEKRFHDWFDKELRWRGVVGHAPSSTQFSEALQNHDVFVYCGHGTGREFLSTDHFQLLSCQATTLLMGCGSGKLVVGGVCDPVGMALNYLLAGCPSLVAILWDVTDGDIDRLSKSLLEQWLEGAAGEGEEEEEVEERGEDGSGLALSLALAKARSVCKLEGLNGYAAVLYGDPCVAVT